MTRHLFHVKSFDIKFSKYLDKTIRKHLKLLLATQNFVVDIMEATRDHRC